MRAHWFQHVAFEGLGSIAGWLAARGIETTCTRFDQAAELPDLADVDWLIVMGGPMSVNDEHLHPWLADEKRFVRDAMAAGRRVLGICLGAQGGNGIGLGLGTGGTGSGHAAQHIHCPPGNHLL